MEPVKYRIIFGFAKIVILIFGSKTVKLCLDLLKI